MSGEVPGLREANGLPEVIQRDSTKLAKALNRRGIVKGEQVRYASIILGCNGIDAALAYVRDLPDALVPLEAAEEAHYQDLQRPPAPPP